LPNASGVASDRTISKDRVMSGMSEELFSVSQFFADDSYEYVRRNVGAEEAVRVAHRYCNSVAADCGITRRVIITDSGDCTNFEWQYGKGITFK
jgi:hypothetical protein